MVEVDFTKNRELYDFFKKVWKNDGVITIVGINSRGDRFETTGRIASDYYSDTMCVYDNFIYLHFGKEVNASLIAPYFTIDSNREKITPKLFIKEIKDAEGNNIFTNPNFEQIQKDVKENAIREKENEEKDGFDIKEDDAVTAKLRKMIGQPVVLENNNGRTYGVLTEIRGSAVDGSTNIIISSGVRVKTIFVNENTALFTVAKNGKLKCVANNAAPSQIENTNRIMEDRRERIANHLDPEAE